ncbi:MULTISPECIES: YfgM family protein [Gulbenkiania]|uniref:Ancillary SecYEG translocon subunit n=2 Tax=Gulbenkiania TaxID=397456 RepID=A0A0K6H461_9NEIS|nr:MULTISPECIES: tetratricopeptide repeat protein [Gulbenkiania]TCW30299.1 putative negative regulator of RcsB-dependent stress response [Gulbenkiania mobilis]CUA85596.1 Putative negative regulator of RcsB-dependent stress response [Gulbenkiania indica]
MAFDLQEQEQLDSLKAFWQQWGKWIATAVLVASAGYVGYKGYTLYLQKQSEEAGTLYAQLERQSEQPDLAKLKPLALTLQKDYGATAYAARSAFVVARAAFAAGDLATARQQLEWITKESADEGLTALARLRLAAVLTDEKRYDAAITELNQPHPASFDALFLDAKGDVYVARGDKRAASDAYKAALAKLTGESPDRQFIQTKLDALGG